MKRFAKPNVRTYSSSWHRTRLRSYVVCKTAAVVQLSYGALQEQQLYTSRRRSQRGSDSNPGEHFSWH